ncbi:MAG TPA: hypothetical protein VNQ79_29155 [Blastocatellia bacterium]|nr:hypothetical protein [Blastocatellia bacterium]
MQTDFDSLLQKAQAVFQWVIAQSARRPKEIAITTGGLILLLLIGRAARRRKRFTALDLEVPELSRSKISPVPADQPESPVRVISPISTDPKQNIPASLHGLLPHRLEEYSLTILEVAGDGVWLLHRKGNEWMDVIAPKRSSKTKLLYDRFGYHLIEARWSYRTSPKNASLIKDWIGRRLADRATEGI